jgi:hypothetical protein
MLLHGRMKRSLERLQKGNFKYNLSVSAIRGPGAMQGRYLTVGHVIKSLLPNGTRHGLKKKDKWAICPRWPPDLFAVCATLAEKSGYYAEPDIILTRRGGDRSYKRRRAKRAAEIGFAWSESPRAASQIQSLWSTLIKFQNSYLCSGSEDGKLWKRAASLLLAVADEACSGVGYEPSEGATQLSLSEFVWTEIREAIPRREMYSQLPNSITHMVPADVCCVLPKAMTPEVGCTVRSLSHHLALLPGLGVVKSEWYVGGPPRRRAREPRSAKQETKKPLNLLLVPFPFVIHASDFVETRSPEHKVDGYFKIDQGWLWYAGRRISVNQFSKFVSDLIKSAELDTKPIQGVIFPEAALDRKLSVQVARILLKKFRNLEFVICGALTSDRETCRNEAIMFRMVKGQLIAFRQSKHHRWQLDGRQIIQYHLGGSLDPKFKWWEDIDLHDRTLQFSVDSHEAVIAALVCEDLARHDPVLPVISAIGPSLVVALLLDGPQLEARWSARYATVLAEDPGSSILTLTSVGLIRRAKKPGDAATSVIGLWKDRESKALELALPDGNQGLVLCLTNKSAEQRTLDGRSDGENLVEYRLGGVQAVRLKHPPEWLERDR